VVKRKNDYIKAGVTIGPERHGSRRYHATEHS